MRKFKLGFGLGDQENSKILKSKKVHEQFLIFSI